MKFPFYDAPNTATITCCHILENGEPILYVSHDEDDGMWQFLCGKAHETDEAKLVSLKSVFDLDNSVGILKDMPCGYYAERKAQDDEWSVRKWKLSARLIQVWRIEKIGSCELRIRGVENENNNYIY